MAQSKKEKAQAFFEARDTVRRCFPAGSTVYTICESVSRSGMSRKLRVVAMTPTGPSWPNYAVSVLTGYRLVRGFQDGVISKGRGFDHGEALAEAIGHALGYEGPDRLSHCSL